MPTLTLLELVQDVLSDMDSDEVNSIDDTVEATQVAQIIKTTFFEIINDGVWPHLGQLLQLTASGDNNKPTHMTLPEDVRYMEWIKYNKRTSTDTKDKYAAVEYVEPLDFIEKLNQRVSSSSNIKVVTDDSGISLLVLTTAAPTYYTSFDNDSIVFDSYDTTVDTTLQASKVQSFGYREPTFSLADAFVPDLPSKAFPYLLSESKSVAFNALKQTSNPKEEQRSNRQKRRLSQERWRYEGGITYPNYGRKGFK